MDPIQQREWDELKAAARAQILGSYQVEETGLQCLARIIVDPAFITLESWRLLRRNTARSPGYSVRWLLWNPERDFSRVMAPTGKLPVERRYRLRSLPPRLETGEAELPPEVAETLLHRLTSVAVPCYAPAERIGCDGVTYRLRTGDYFSGVEYSWWVTPPEPWLPLQEVVDAMLQTFRGLLP